MNSLTSLTEYEHGMQYVEYHDYENESAQYADDVMSTSEWLELSDAVDDDWMRLLAGLLLHIKNNNDSKHIRDKVIQCYQSCERTPHFKAVMNHTHITNSLYGAFNRECYLIFLNQTLHYPKEYDIIVSMSSYRRYNYRAYPTKGQRAVLACLYGACRYAYNWVISQRDIMRTRHGKMQTYAQLSSMFTQWKHDPDHQWLQDMPAVPLQQSIRHADTAYKNFFKLYNAGKTKIIVNKRTGKKRITGKPRFKSRRDGEQSAEFTKAARFKVEHVNGCKWGFLTLPKIGRIKIRWTRDMPSTPNSVNMMKHADGTYEVSFVVQVDDTIIAPEPLHDACGIDMGLDSLMSIVYADGTREKIPHPRTLRKHAHKLCKLDKQLARQEKGSNNREKTRILRAKTYSRIRNQRRDMAFKLASKVAGENQAVALETLNVKGLARTRLAKSLLDANWTRIIDRIRLLAVQYGRDFHRIDRWYPSSQICSVCGHRDGKKPLNVRAWECPECGAYLDRDWNAALNILDAAGLAESLNAREGDVRRRLACSGCNANAREAGTHRTASLH